MSFKHQIAQTIKEKRENSQLSQDKLAAKADISTRFYRSIEAGDYNPSIHTIYKLAKALDIHYTELLESSWNEWLKNPDQEEI